MLTDGDTATVSSATRSILNMAASRDEIEESSKTSIGLFVACCDASEWLKMAEEVLDQMAPFVHFVIMRDAPGAVGLGRDARCGPAFIEVGTQPVVVEGFVADERRKSRPVIKGSTPM